MSAYDVICLFQQTAAMGQNAKMTQSPSTPTLGTGASSSAFPSTKIGCGRGISGPPGVWPVSGGRGSRVPSQPGM